MDPGVHTEANDRRRAQVTVTGCRGPIVWTVTGSRPYSEDGRPQPTEREGAVGHYAVGATFGLVLGLSLGFGWSWVRSAPSSLAEVTTAPSPVGGETAWPSNVTPSGRVPYDEDLIAAIYERVSPSVVNVTTRLALESLPGAGSRQGTGSGIVLDTDGHILTNHHVVDDAGDVEVTLADGTHLAARIRGWDVLNDLAVLKVETPPERLRPVTLGDSGSLQVGQLAIAIGNPYGFSRTLTVGVVSGLGRPIEDAGRRPLLDMVQTDAAINPGSSGGPLLNVRGEVIGITTLVDRSQLNVGFAIPANTARRVLPTLIAGEPVRHPWLGIAGVNLSPLVAEQLGTSIDDGILIREATADGPAARAGLRGGTSADLGGGDVIRSIDGRPVTRVADLVAYINTRQVGESVGLVVNRDGADRSLRVTLGEYPDDR